MRGGMPEPVFTENGEGLVHLKTLYGAFTPCRFSILPIASDERGGRGNIISVS